MRAAIGCQNPPCVRQKLEFLAHYAALYCDRVFVPLPLINPDSLDTSGKKSALEESIRTLGVLRPVIEAGFVSPVTMTTSHCVHMGPMIKKTRSIVNRAAKDLRSDAL